MFFVISRAMREERRRTVDLEASMNSSLSRASDELNEERTRLETDIAKLEARTYELHNRCRKANEEKMALQKQIKQLKGDLMEHSRNAQ